MNETLVVILNGRSRSGKDTFVGLCQKNFNKPNTLLIDNISSVDLVKEAATILGWDGTKTEQNRTFLYKLKWMADAAFDSSNQYILKKVSTTKAKILFVHVREPKCIKSLAKRLHNRGIRHYTVCIESSRPDVLANSVADLQICNYKYDYIIRNDNTIEELELQAIQFIDSITKEG